jgi:hypothetical protein
MWSGVEDKGDDFKGIFRLPSTIMWIPTWTCWDIV